MGSNNKDVIDLHKDANFLKHLPPFKRAGLKLTGLLDKIRAEAPRGKPAPPAAKAPQGTTDAGAKAYGNGYGEAKKTLEEVVKSLTFDEVKYLSGIGFRNISDEKSSRDDVINSALSAWDTSAAKYMKNQQGAGDAAKAQFQERMDEFDAALLSKGKPPVKADPQ